MYYSIKLFESASRQLSQMGMIKLNGKIQATDSYIGFVTQFLHAFFFNKKAIVY